MELFVISCAGLAWFLAQGAKTVLALFQRRRPGLVAAFTATGGMPSSHSAFVTGLTGAMYYRSGMSLVFVLSLALAILTIRDALGVRKTVDAHAEVLNELMAAQAKSSAVRPVPLPTNAGHHFHEAACGVALGVVAVVVLVQLPFFSGVQHAFNR